MTIGAGRLRLRFGYPAAAAICACAVVLGERYPAALLCAVIHEAGHIAALLRFGQERIDIRLRVTRTDIIDSGKGSRPDRQQALVSLAGPLANAAASPLFYALYASAACPFLLDCAMISAALCVFNLLPMFGTDGGELAAIALSRRLSEKAAHNIMTALTGFFLLPVFAASFYALLRTGSNVSLLIFAFAAAAEGFSK